MRLFTISLALALTTSAALAGDVSPLPPGAPAGVKRAQISSENVLLGLLGVGALAGFAVALTSGSNSSQLVSAPTTTSIASTS